MACHDIRPSHVQLIRRLSMDSFMVRVYTGPLSGEFEYVSVEADKGTTAEDVVAIACRKLRFGGGDTKKKFELAEVFSSGGQLCKERRLDSTENPVALQLLWPKSSDIETGVKLFDGYRFYLRKRDPELSPGGWVVRDQSAVDSFLLAFLTQPLAGKEFPDLCSLPDLNEKTLLHNLKSRFNQKNIYTYVGSILIAVNPFKFFPIYNPKYVSMYQNKRLGELPPHIFAVADAAYHSMLRQKQNQCIVISGESGSGKTESTNLLLHHLTALSHKGLHGSGVEQTILGAGPVLEAFGNAKTVHNNNSSRFGKFIQVNYKQNGMVHGAIVEKYLLEKSRIVFQAKNERNYHVFYYLLAGADEREREAFHLMKADQYNYLSQSACYSVEGVDEEHEFARLKQSMEMVGFSPETQRKIFSVLSAVLQLGNIEFKKKGDKHHDESVMVKTGDAIKTISNLLKVKERYVLEAMTQKKTTAGDETFVINYKMEDAIATRDAMAKCIYGTLFDWIVLKVNQALLAKKHDSEHEGDSIGVLDIFGFEDFGNNSFEQFCINYANEHLQYYFNQHIFKFEQEEYQREGIQWKNIEFIDNTGSLEIFSKRPSGLFYLLDEECSFPGATNETLLNKCTHHHKNNPHYQVPQLKEGAFSIMHYAGRVKYLIKDFREKNLDLVRSEIVDTLKKSSLAFVRELMGIDPVAVLRWSVVRAFFRCFFAFKKAGEHYRKNGGKESRRRQKRVSDPSLQDVFNENLLNRQETDILQQKQFKEDVNEELLLYSSLESTFSENDIKVIRKAQKLLMKNKSFRPKQRPSLSFRDIKALKAIAGRTMPGSVRGTGSKKQPPTVGAQFQWSLSRLMTTLNQANPYFIRCIKSNKEKAPCVFDEELVMRQLRYTGMLATVKIRQSGYNYRLLIQEFIQLYKILLPCKPEHTKGDIKDFLTAMGLQEENYQIGMTKIFLRETEKLKLDEALHSAIMKRVITIQRWVKTCLARREFLQLKEATILMQKHIRRYLAERDFHIYQQHQADAATRIQCLFRGYLARRDFMAQCGAIVYMQSYIRAVLMRRRLLNLRKMRNNKLKLEAEKRERERMDKERQEEVEKLRLEVERIEKQAKEEMEKEEAEKAKKDQLSVIERLDSERGRERKEELQSTASDEGVLMKASSTEELEEKDPIFLPRRDSEESSGIMEDSEPECGYTKPAEKPVIDTPPPTPPSDKRKPIVTTPVANEDKAKSRKSQGRISDLAKTFQTLSDTTKPYSSQESVDGRKSYLLYRSSQQPRQKAAAPLARQESFSDREFSFSESHEHHRPKPIQIPERTQLSENELKKLDNVVGHYKDELQKKEQNETDHDQFSGHLSPINKAKKHWKIFTGTKKPKKDDSEEESEESSVSSVSRSSIEKKGISVLPAHYGGAMVPSSPSSHSKEEEDVTKTPATRARVKKVKKRPNNKPSSSSPARPQTRSNMNVARATEWQYADTMVITELEELRHLDVFIGQKHTELYGDSANRRYTIFDKIFKGALEKFRKELKSQIAVEAGKAKVQVRYRDLFEQFRNLLTAEMKQEMTDAPLVMSVNAFRGFLDEFRKLEESRQKDSKKDVSRNQKKMLKREKHKKNEELLEFNGHRYQQVQFNIVTFCEVCSSLIWIMDKGYVCQECKFACHKKCHSKQNTPCKGGSGNKNQQSSQLFGARLEALVSEKQKIPLVCERLMSTIEKTGLYTEGIYRKSGAAPKVKELQAALESDIESVNLDDYAVHVLAATLKLFLRLLPEPLLTFDLYDELLRSMVIKDERELIKSLFDIIRKLPKANYDLFERLVFHLARVAMHSDSNKMSPNALSVVFAPVLLGTNKKIQAQDAIALVPQQMMCIEYVLKEQLRTIQLKLDDIDTLESAEKTAGERLNAIRASLRTTKKSPMSSPVKQPSVKLQDEEIDQVIEEKEEEEEELELKEEERVLSRHLASIHKEKDKLTYKLPMLETRQASSDEDVLSGDEVDADSDKMNEEYAVNFDLPVVRPSLPHITKHRTPVPHSRKLPKRYAKKVLAFHKSHSDIFEDTSEACLPEPIPTISIKPPTGGIKSSPYSNTMTVESSYVTVPGLNSTDDDEIMV